MKTILKLVFVPIFLAVSLFTNPLHAQAPIYTPTVIQQTTPISIVEHYSRIYDVSMSQMITTLKCESNFNSEAVGDHGKSFGIAQIYLPAHPDISKEQALDPEFAIEFMAQQFSKGNARIWTCYRIHYT